MTDTIKYMTVDERQVAIENEANILAVIRKAGIQMPTFCYHSDLSIYGACRMCVVEIEGEGIQAACSTRPREGMVLRTNTLELRKHRKMILELLLANHCRDCTTCSRNRRCKLQVLAIRFGISSIRFSNTNDMPKIDSSSASIVRDESKCILCGDCVRICDEIQGIGAINFAYRGSSLKVCPAFDKPIAETNCVNCGQCAAVCPTGAIVIKNDCHKLEQFLDDKNKRVVVQVAPAVRVALGEEFELGKGENSMDKIVPALRHLGFDAIFDTSLAADLTVIEESKEFLARINKNENLPLFTSCCPAWVKYAENRYPEFLANISTCRSPQQMFGAVLKEHYKNIDQIDGKQTISVAIMPCTAKKYEAQREEFKRDNCPDVDIVITTQELALMIKESGIIFAELEAEATDMPFGLSSGAGVIFGVTGGVTEAVIRKVAADKSFRGLQNIAYSGVRGMNGLKELTIPYGETEIKIAIVSGLANADALLKKIKSGELSYHLIEVMACPGGCISGAGQPFALDNVKKSRAKGLYSADKMSQIKRSEENPMLMSLYNGLLKGKTHELLHVEYKN